MARTSSAGCAARARAPRCPAGRRATARRRPPRRGGACGGDGGRRRSPLAAPSPSPSASASAASSPSLSSALALAVGVVHRPAPRPGHGRGCCGGGGDGRWRTPPPRRRRCRPRRGGAAVGLVGLGDRAGALRAEQVVVRRGVAHAGRPGCGLPAARPAALAGRPALWRRARPWSPGSRSALPPASAVGGVPVAGGCGGATGAGGWNSTCGGWKSAAGTAGTGRPVGPLNTVGAGAVPAVWPVASLLLSVSWLLRSLSSIRAISSQASGRGRTRGAGAPHGSS